MTRIAHQIESILIYVTLIALVSGCVPSVQAPLPTPVPTASSAVVSTSPVQTLTPTPCGYSWAYRAAPTKDALLKDAFAKAGFQAFVNSQAFGEVGGPGCDFHTMSYDLDVIINDPTVTDDDALGNLALKALKIIGGANKLRLTINGSGVGFRGEFRSEQAEALIDKGLTGRTLIEELRKL